MTSTNATNTVSTQTDSSFVWDEAQQAMRPIATQDVKDAVVESEQVLTAKAKLAEAKRLLALAQGKTPGKKGRAKVYNYPRVLFGAQVAKDKFDKAKALMPADSSVTDMVNLALDLLVADLEAKANQA